MKIRCCMFIVLALLVSTAGFAKESAYSTTAVAAYHFSKAKQRPIAGVYVHTGTRMPDGGWVNVQHLKMKDYGHHYFAKAALKLDEGYTNSVDPRNNSRVDYGTPVVQYWVYFQDGTLSYSPIFEIPKVGSRRFSGDDRHVAEECYNAAKVFFDDLRDTDRTGYTDFSASWGHY